MTTITINLEVHRLLSRALSYAKMPFIFLIWLLVGSCVGIQQDACRTLRFTKPMNGNTLAGHIIRNLKVEAESSCKLSCYFEANCVSFNTGPLQDGKHVCELSDSDHHIHPQDLITREGYVYWSTKQNFCLSNACNPTNTLTCQSGFSERGFRCVCKAGYQGNNCDEAFPMVAAYPKIILTSHGNHVTFSCNATGTPKPLITWSKSQGRLPASSSVSSEGTLTILNVRTEDSGWYVCNAANTVGTNSSSVGLQVFCSLVAINKSASKVVLYVGQALQLSCPASVGAAMVWMHNGTTTLPQGALNESQNTLIIFPLSKDHVGNFSCTSGNSLLLKINLSIKYPETCTTVKQHICDVSRHYVIDPDGERGEARFTVYCNMTAKGGIGVTSVSHDSEARFHVKGFENPGSYHRDIHYINASINQIKGLIEISKNCQQFIKYECKNSVLRGFDVQSPKLYGWWVSRDGEVMTYWGGASEGCACGMSSSCVDPQRLCNCDINDNDWHEDSGLLTNKSHLPVSQLRFGDTGHSVEDGYHTLGDLECYDMN